MTYLKHIGTCECGAITFEDEQGTQYSCLAENLTSHTNSKLLVDPGDMPMQWGSCNHCVNHWGLDLCACGSGEQPDECTNGLEMCGTSHQHIED